MAVIYRKTDKGHAEIDTRAHRLLPMLRQSLILVDGKRTDETLGKMLPEADKWLATLRADGFIEVLATLAERPADKAEAQPAADAAVNSARKGPSATAAPGGSSGASPDTVRRDAVRFLNDQMGPSAEGISMKLEKAKSMTDLRPLLVVAAQLLRSARGADAAETFTHRFLGEELV